MNAARDAHAAHCIELLSALGPVQARRMFGGHGLYLDGLIIGLLVRDTLYLKTDAESIDTWRSAGGHPFTYTHGRPAGGGEAAAAKTVETSYWSPPPEALDAPHALLPWARLALAAALRAQAAKAPKRPRRAAAKRAAR